VTCAAGTLLVNRARGATATTARADASIAIVCDPTDAIAMARPAQWAVGELHRALTNRGFSVHVCTHINEAGPTERCIVAAGRTSSLARHVVGVTIPTEPEALAIVARDIGQREILFAIGSDSRGLIYALTDIADAIALGADSDATLRPATPIIERPANRVRSVMRLFASDVEDKPWFNDRDFWRGYFSLLIAQRFNRVNLALGLGYDQPIGLRDTYFYFAYPFLVSVPGYDVHATNLPDAERDRNLEMLRWISDEAAAHGLDFQLGIWTHAYQWKDSPKANHVIEGLTPQTQAPYCRDALAIVLKECPNITGVTIRIHGESGVPEGSYDLWRTIFDGCVRSGRRVGLDLHAKGMDQPTLDAALATGLPLTISPKFWAEHMGLPYPQAAIRPTELPTGKPGKGPFTMSEGSRSFLRYGYGDLLREDRRYAIVHRIWPGTQRMLLWGDPLFASAYGRAAGFCGSAGCEVFDPLSFKGRKGSGLPGGRDGYLDLEMRAPDGDFEKYRLTHRLWGRLFYNPDTPPAVWERQLSADYGSVAAASVGAALAHASRILPLFTTAHCPSAANNHFWPEMYVNMAIVDPTAPIVPYTDTLEPKRFNTVSPLDPQLFSRVIDFADELLSDQVSGKYSPVEVAQWMEDFAQTAADALASAEAKAIDHRAPAFRRFAIDTATLIGLGRFFGRKFRAATLFALHERTDDHDALAAAIETYRSARDEWTRIAAITTNVYVKDVTYGDAWYQRGHWADRLAAIEKDLAAMEQRSAAIAATAPAIKADPKKLAALIQQVLGRPERPTAEVAHVPAPSFSRGAAIDVKCVTSGERRMKLYYRHTDQAEPWVALEMRRDGDTHQAAIPANYTDSVYPLEYYFEVTEASRQSWLHPGLGPSLTRQPYFVIRSA